MPVIDMVGKRRGRLTVLKRHGYIGAHAAWLCRCDCGQETVVRGNHLRNPNGTVKSCGCLRRDNMAWVARTKPYTRHGHSRRGPNTPTYVSWQAMKTRCTNPSQDNYPYYGGRGVKICRRFREFSSFLEDMGERPEDLTLDRTDPFGHYSCGKCDECEGKGWLANCRWVTRAEQSRNQRRWLAA